jgi:CRP/FNR family transcriptional regulator
MSERGNHTCALRDNELFAGLSGAGPAGGGLSGEELEYLEGCRRAFRRGRGESVFMQGDVSDAVYFLCEGRVKVSKISPDGRKLTLDVIGPGEFFGELAISGEKERGTMAEAVTDARGYSIGKNALEKFFHRRPDIAIKMIQLMGNKRLSAETFLEEMIFMDVEARISALFLKYSENGVVKIPLTHQEIADMTGATRVSVSRSIARLRGRGAIETTGDRIKVNFKKNPGCEF